MIDILASVNMILPMEFMMEKHCWSSSLHGLARTWFGDNKGENIGIPIIMHLATEEHASFS